MWQHLLRNAATCILYPHDRLLLRGIDPDGDGRLAMWSREFRRVLKEVADHLGDPRLVAVDPDLPAPGQQLEFHLHLREERAMVLNGAANELGEIEWFELQSDLAARDARDIEQVVEKAGEMVDLAADGISRLPILRAVRHGAIEDKEAVGDRRERVSEFMRQGGKELVLMPVRLAEVLVRLLDGPLGISHLQDVGCLEGEQINH